MSNFFRLAAFVGLLLVMARPRATGADAVAPTAPAIASSPAPAPPPPLEQEQKICWSGMCVPGPYIALTFDDGPDGELTPRLLDILKARNIHVTFFVVGQNAQRYPEIVKRELAEGHEIGNHSWDHPNLRKMSDDLVRSELIRTRDAITAACGKPPACLRPPYGKLTPEQQSWVYRDFGYPTILWDVNTQDWRHPGPAVVEQRILAGVRNGCIILDHDIQSDAVEAMPETLDKLLARGFKFATVSELTSMSQPVPPGAVTR